MIQIDVWGGDLHQNLVREHLADHWAKASALIEAEVEAGCLVNVLHLDFKCPPDREQEAAVDLIHNLTAIGEEAADRIEELEAKLTIAMVGLVQSRDALDLYSHREYSSHPAYDRYRQRDYDTNPARIALAELKGQDDEL